jgi:hypothetical protein
MSLELTIQSDFQSISIPSLTCLAPPLPTTLATIIIVLCRAIPIMLDPLIQGGIGHSGPPTLRWQSRTTTDTNKSYHYHQFCIGYSHSSRYGTHCSLSYCVRLWLMLLLPWEAAGVLDCTATQSNPSARHWMVEGPDPAIENDFLVRAPSNQSYGRSLACQSAPDVFNPWAPIWLI